MKDNHYIRVDISEPITATEDDIDSFEKGSFHEALLNSSAAASVPHQARTVRAKIHGPINFATGSLIQKWCRHQYLKGLLPSLMIVWYFSFILFEADYEERASNYIRQKSGDYNCTIVEKERLTFFPMDCSGANLDTQYYLLDNRAIGYLLTVGCTLPGVHFYYDQDYWGFAASSDIVQIILNFIAPLIFTYFIYETCILAVYDCLVIIPGLDEKTGKPILRYVDGPYRVSWFIIRDWYQNYYCNDRFHDGNEKFGKNLAGTQKPGIRIGYITSLCINWFIVLFVTTTAAFLTSRGDIHRCSDFSDYALQQTRVFFLSLLFAYLLIILIPTCRYYYQLFFYIKDLEILATHYSDEFASRRYGGIRNLLDLFPTLFVPLLPNCFYYSLWVLPNTIFYLFYKAVVLSFSLCCDHQSSESLRQLDQQISRYYEHHVFNLSDRWWCRWFIRSIDEVELRSWEPLLTDRDS